MARMKKIIDQIISNQRDFLALAYLFYLYFGHSYYTTAWGKKLPILMRYIQSLRLIINRIHIL